MDEIAKLNGEIRYCNDRLREYAEQVRRCNGYGTYLSSDMYRARMEYQTRLDKALAKLKELES